MPGDLQNPRENDKMHLSRVILFGFPGKIGSAPVLQHWGCFISKMKTFFAKIVRHPPPGRERGVFMMTKIYLYLPYPDVYAIYLVPEHIVIINLDHHGTTKVTILI